MPMIGFLWGEVVEGGLINDRLFYILEEAEWFISVLDLLKDCQDSSKKTSIRVTEVGLATSGTEGTSCLLMKGWLPDSDRTRRWLNWSFPSVPVRLPYDLTWQDMPNASCLPFQCVKSEIVSYHSYLTEKYAKATAMPPRPHYTIANKVWMTPTGLVYSFDLDAKGKDTSPTLIWERIEEAVEPFRNTVRSPKRQTVIIRPNPGLKGV